MITVREPTFQEWINEHAIGDEMYWKSAAGRQLQFMRDKIKPLVAAGLPRDELARDIDRVISSHRSKSIALPVYELSRPDLGLRLIARDNFHDWKLSVLCERSFDADFSGLFSEHPPVDPGYTGDSLASCYFEGFPESLVFGYRSQCGRGGPQRWSAQIATDEAFWATIFLTMRALGALKAHRSLTREEHRAQLDEHSRRDEARRARDKALEAKRTHWVERPRAPGGERMNADFLRVSFDDNARLSVNNDQLQVLMLPGNVRPEDSNWWRVGRIVTERVENGEKIDPRAVVETLSAEQSAAIGVDVSRPREAC